MSEEKKDKKPSFFKRIARSFRDMRGEVKKVVWPSKKHIIRSTGIVIAMVVLSSAVVGGLDFILKLAVDLILRNV